MESLGPYHAMGEFLGIIITIQDDQEGQKHSEIGFLGKWSHCRQFLAILAIKEAEISTVSPQSCSQSNCLSKKVCHFTVTQKLMSAEQR